MPETRDFAKLGRTTWRAQIWFDDGDDPTSRCLAWAEHPNLDLTKAWVNRTLPVHRPLLDDPPPGGPWARVERGTYQDESFDDDEFGFVSDASWEPDDAQRFGYLNANQVDVDWAEA